MKHLFLILITLIVSPSIFAQRVDSDNIKVIYSHLPDRPLPLSVKTYSIKIVNNLTDFKFTTNEINLFRINGFKEVPENGDIELYFYLKSLNVKTEITSKQVKKTVDGKEVLNTVYSYKISTRLECDYKITSGPDHSNIINTYYIGRTSNNESKTFATKVEAENELKKNINELVNESKHACLNEALLGAQKSNNDNYGYFPVSEVIKIASAKGGKFDYSDLDTAMVTFKNAILLYNDQKFGDYNKQADQCIDVWAKALKEYDPANKKARINSKIAPKLYLNIAYANLFMNKFSEAYVAVKKHDEIQEVESKDLLADIVDRENRNFMNEHRLKDKISFLSKPKIGPLARKLSAEKYKLFLADSSLSIDKINPYLIKILEIARYYPFAVKWRNGSENDYLFSEYEYIKDDIGMIEGVKINYAQYSYLNEIVTLNMDDYPTISSMTITRTYLDDSQKPKKYDTNLNFRWEEGKVTYFKSSVNTEEFELQYDNEGRISKIIDKELTKDPDKGMSNRAYIFEYSENRIAKEFSGRIAKSLFKIEHENIYTYENSGIIQESIKYKEGKPLPESKSKFTSNKIDKFHYRFEKSTPNENTVTENTFNENGFVVTNLFSWGEKKRITTNVYSSEDTVLETTIDNYVNGLVEGKVVIRNYSKTEGIDTRKPYEWQEGKYKFDKNGDWIYEERNNKFRIKENDVWSSWRGFVY